MSYFAQCHPEDYEAAFERLIDEADRYRDELRDDPALRLVAFVREHPPADARPIGGGKLLVSTDAVKDGEVTRIEEEIPATLKAVRDWLGY